MRYTAQAIESHINATAERYGRTGWDIPTLHEATGLKKKVALLHFTWAVKRLVKRGTLGCDLGEK